MGELITVAFGDFAAKPGWKSSAGFKEFVLVWDSPTHGAASAHALSGGVRRGGGLVWVGIRAVRIGGEDG